jgi:hypothetical protein
MLISKNRLYIILLIACGAGYIYLFNQVLTHAYLNNSTDSFCLIKRFLHIPCPSCGVTRSVIAILHGHLYSALLLNPLGFIVLAIMLIAPVLIVHDLLQKRSLFYDAYNKLETKIRQPKTATVLIALIIANWIWNIYKGI